MCGRFAQIEPIGNIIKAFYIDDVLTEIAAAYNIAPGSAVISVVKKDSHRILVDFTWGLIPHWARETSIGRKLINARSESIHQKPSFREAFRSRRCLIVASGFYEWKKEGRVKIPYYIRRADGAPFAFAGLHESWRSPDGVEHGTCAIITTEPNALMKEIHTRMPVILPREHEESWLDTSLSAGEALSLLIPYGADEMEAYPVSAMVNSTENNSPECIKPL